MSRDTARLYLDGDMWCAVPPGFRDLAITFAGFGRTKEEAVLNYNNSKSVKHARRVDDFVVGKYCMRCLEWVPEGDVMEGCRDPHCPCQ